MLSNKRIKNSIAGTFAFLADFITFTLLLFAIPLFIIQSGLQDVINPIVKIPAEIIIPAILISLFLITNSYKSSTLATGFLSIKRPLTIIWGTSVLLIFILINQPESPVNSTSYLLKIVVIAAIYSSFLLANRIVIQLFIALLFKNKIIRHRVVFAFYHSIHTPYLKEFLRRIETNHQTLVGYCSNKKSNHPNLQNKPVLGKYIETIKICKEENIDEVIIFNHTQSIKHTEQILTNIDTKKVLVRIAPEGKEMIVRQNYNHQPDEIPTLSIQPKVATFSYKIFRRVFDMIVGLVGIAITLLLFPFLGYKIKRDSKGPILYKQLRQNKKGGSFKLYKFRTMYVDAEKDGPTLASKNLDPRITGFGHILRRLHLDELPQFWNILKGDMSVVGIRPEREYFINLLEKQTPYYKFIRKVKPGLTSLAMVKYGYAHNLEEMKERMLYDIIYVNNRSILFDLQIIGYTINYIFNKLLLKSDKG